jgi:mono/diheme cytochrome c family protein
MDGEKEYRYMLPEFYMPTCIQCHGTNPGQEGKQIHPTSLARRVGDFAGAISVTIKK